MIQTIADVHLYAGPEKGFGGLQNDQSCAMTDLREVGLFILPSGGSTHVSGKI